MPDLIVTLLEGTLSLTFNRPDSCNALTTQMIEALAVTLEDVAPSDDVKVVVITGVGDSFCVGTETNNASGEAHGGASERHGRVIRAITRLDKPVVAGVHGVVRGFGCAIAVACDVIVAAESASFQLSPDRTGAVPDGGLSASLAMSVGRHRAMRMVLLGDALSADQAYDAGLVAVVTRAEHLAPTVARISRRLANAPALETEFSKRAINAATLGGLPQALSREARAHCELNGLGRDEFWSSPNGVGPISAPVLEAP